MKLFSFLFPLALIQAKVDFYYLAIIEWGSVIWRIMEIEEAVIPRGRKTSADNTLRV